MGAENMAKERKTISSKQANSINKLGVTKAPIDRQVTVRMYNVGFGDAFLVLVPDGKSTRRILFDCGSIEVAPGVPMKGIVDRIVRDVTDTDGIARIDIVVATHRHKDHVSGFADAAWDNVEVKEVWMPWTEDTSDDEARRIRDIQNRLAIGLNLALNAKAANLDAAKKKELSRYQDIVSNALMLSNDKAMKTLHSGFSGNPKRRFLPTNVRGNRTFETDALPGAKVHVMGPSRDRDVIRDMDPPRGKSFLRIQGGINEQTGLPPAPFSIDFREDSYIGGGIPPTDTDLQEIQQAGSQSDLAVAVALDKAVNGTSLMLVLQVYGTYLLFPGDAQWGTWNAAMEDTEWKEILKRVTFYKIAHHGSHNATPKDFVEKIIPEGICAMASTLTRQIWPEIPKSQLLSGLANKDIDIARSDQEDKAVKPFIVDKGVIEVRIPT